MNVPLKPLDQDRPLALADIVRLIKKGRTAIFALAFLCAICAILFALIRTPIYQVEATFRDKGSSGGSMGSSSSMMSTLLSGLGGVGSDQGIISLLKSRQLMAPVIETLGLQAQVFQDQPSSRLTTIITNLAFEWAKRFGDAHAHLEKRIPFLAARDVRYSGERTLNTRLLFDDADHFRLERSDGQLIGRGELGIPFHPLDESELTFTLIQQVPGDLSGQTLSLALSPLPDTALTLASHLKIKPAEVGESVLKITFEHGDRHIASAFVNGLMDSYKQFTSNENERFSQRQLDYLKGRQEESLEELNSFMMDYALSLANDVSSSGIISTEKELNYLYTARQKNKNRFEEVTLKLRRLQNPGSTETCNYRNLCAMPDLTVSMLEKINQIARLTEQKDSLNIALEASQQKSPEEIHQLFDHQVVDLEAAKALQLNLHTQLNETEVSIKENQFILEQLRDPAFEISSVAVSLSDPVGQTLMNQASQRILSLKDTENRSGREQTRLREELEQQRAFLTGHLTQANELMSLRQAFLTEKLSALQRVFLDLIKQELNVYQTQLTDYVFAQKDYLQTEQKLIEQTQEELRDQMALLPIRWAAEQIIQQRIELNKALVEEIATLVESKNISNHLEMVQSGPVDLAVTPLLPKSSGLLVFAVLGACLGAGLGVGGVVLNGIKKGLPASPENLRLADQHVAGYLTNQSEQQIETLRRLAAYLCTEGQSVFLLMMGQGPDYSPEFAELLAKRGDRVLRISLAFDTEGDKKERPGLLQVLEGQAGQPLILSHGEYDHIGSGGRSSYRAELIGGRRFQTLLKGWMQQYDAIILAAPIKPDGGEAAALAGQFSAIAVTLDGERLQDLGPLLSVPRVSFLFSC